MAIISAIGRRSVRVRALTWSIYFVLLAGSVTMLYPFGLMVAGSTKSAVDSQETSIVPSFLLSDEALYRKYVEGLFNESLDECRTCYDSDVPSFLHVALPGSINAKLAEAWLGFLHQADLPGYAYTIGGIRAPVSAGVMPHALRDFRQRFLDTYGNDIGRMNREMGTEFANWSSFYFLPENYLPRWHSQGEDPFSQTFRQFKQERPLADRYYFSAEGFFKTLFLKTQYAKDIKSYNEAHATKYASWKDVHLDRRFPADEGHTDKERKDWEEFVRSILNLLWIRADGDAVGPYREFLGAKYGTIAALNRNYGTFYGSFDEIPLVGMPLPSGLVLSDWDSFLQGWKDPDTGRMHMLPAGMIRIDSVDFMFRDYLQARYGTIERANAALGTSNRDWLDVLPPQQDVHLLAFRQQVSKLKWEFCRRNFIAVLDYVVLHGRSVLNTAIYCSLAILAALIVNPLAAYALSRYRPPSAYKVLLLLMLTMAFPPMVTQIPAFLMLREFNMLNTFWALILPGLANGYSIFLLKGFFDSLPRELYECAVIDGAGEIRIFWEITMSLSKPILAVIALGAFTTAYSNFMMALLICQDEKMWTLMPWLYQLQLRSGPGVVFASLLIVAVPTFLVFAFCQNTIMRGIVVPAEK